MLEPSIATARRALALLDLTDLSDNADEVGLAALCARAVGAPGPGPRRRLDGARRAGGRSRRPGMDFEEKIIARIRCYWPAAQAAHAALATCVTAGWDPHGGHRTRRAGTTRRRRTGVRCEVSVGVSR